MSLALAAVTVDALVKRSTSPDGWTREFDISVAVSDPDLWSPHASRLGTALSFLTTDIWDITFTSGAEHPLAPKAPRLPATNSVALLSGGLDSLIGAIDLSVAGVSIFAVSHTVRGDRANQELFAAAVRTGSHLQLNHNVNTHASKEPSQRTRSLAFLAYAVLAASATKRASHGETVSTYICENGFIAINPPLTASRLGSLSTRTAHPHFLGELQHVLDDVGRECSSATRTRSKPRAK